MGDIIKDIITPTRLEYTMYAGTAQKRFLRGLQHGRLLAQRCPNCTKVYIPPRGSCPTCAVPTREEVEVADKGTVTTFCVVDLPFYGQAVEIPYVCASILLDGADIPFFALIQEVPATDVRMGMRVKAVWEDSDKRQPSFTAIKYFKPTDEPDAAYESYKDHL
jgi:uncharacterized OB-fold protein